MRAYIIISILAGALALSVAHSLAAGKPVKNKELLRRVEKGRHIVENVAMCADCHSARLPDGSFDKSRWLLGAKLDFAPTVAMPWAPAAPAIAGLPTMSDEEAVSFFMTGLRPSKIPTLPPMPGYRFSREEAEAVVAFLRNVPQERPVQ